MIHHRELAIPPIKLDRKLRLPLQRQIYIEIARAIRTNEIRPGALLPASRTLAGMLGVSRNTVVAAYENLAAEDLIRGEQGCGMRVTGTPNRHAPSSWFTGIIRAAQYPKRVVSISDPDGNSLYLNF